LAGGIVGITLWGFIKLGLSVKQISTWLGVSLMVAAFLNSEYLANVYEKDTSTLDKQSELITKYV
jgi:hypothetical protein